MDLITLLFPAKMALALSTPEQNLISKALADATEEIPEDQQDKALAIQNILSEYMRHMLSYEEAAAQVSQLIGTDQPARKFDEALKGARQNLFKFRMAASAGYRKRARRWTREEDHRLAAAVQVHGTANWPVVATVVGGGRTRSQCSQRWHRGIDPKISKCNWSREEEQKLLDAVQTFGNKAWTRIAVEMKNRSDVQCRFRYRFLVKKAQELGTEVQPISAPMALTHNVSIVGEVNTPFGEDLKVDHLDPSVPETKDAQ